MNEPWGLIAWAVVFMYFLPVAVAAIRGVKPFAGIAIINFFLGWTVLGWVGSLAWAAVADKKPKS